MDAEIAKTLADGGDPFSYASKTDNEKFGFLMGVGMHSDEDSENFAQWRAIELAFYRYPVAAEKSRRSLLSADRRTPDRRASISLGDGAFGAG